MIHVRDVSKVYESGKIRLQALHAVSLTVAEGQSVVFFGPSGSGKSTLLNLIGGMDRPTSGSVEVDGEAVSDYSPRRLTRYRATKIGFVFQSPNLVPALNVYENVTVPMRLKGSKFSKEEVMELIERVGLSGHVRHRPDELSGGQRQRVAIARALVHKPPYIIADEPTANLDSRTAQSIIELLSELNANLRITLLFASHDKLVYDHIPNRVLLHDGRIDDGVRDISSGEGEENESTVH